MKIILRFIIGIFPSESSKWIFPTQLNKSLRTLPRNINGLLNNVIIRLVWFINVLAENAVQIFLFRLLLNFIKINFEIFPYFVRIKLNKFLTVDSRKMIQFLNIGISLKHKIGLIFFFLVIFDFFKKSNNKKYQFFSVNFWIFPRLQ